MRHNYVDRILYKRREKFGAHEEERESARLCVGFAVK